MYRVAKNVSIYYFKKARKRVPSILLDPEVLNFPDSAFDDSEEKLQVLHKLIKDLNLLD